MLGLRDTVDRVLAWLRWPAALLSFATLPVWLVTVVFVGMGLVDQRSTLWIIAGGLGYAGAWWFAFRRPGWGALFSTFEHELTHALFAMLTFHRVVGFRATWRSGGHVRFMGSGNWLIALAPYFFPTLSVFAAVVILVAPPHLTEALWVVLGATVSYHLTSTKRELHREQRDLQSVGFIPSLLFIPSASLATLSLCVSVGAHGPAGFAELGVAIDDALRWMAP